ncbi:hypothetical protein GCM10017044_19980 [Kordiimonas sediminis]|uniref:DUF2141 domain-containing protein n=2 Tax=Kordiimonas sediminis TaxID=1735581 RepID=A0A919AV99_9PROT|nr:hypothetical protein GCM10017044_19980 [Kordiimonas sediminis]
MLMIGYATGVNAEDSLSPAQCIAEPGQALIKVEVDGIRTIEGNVRAQIYGDNPDDFLGKGKKLVRIDVAATDESQTVCVPLPAPGKYAVVIMHDKNANGKADFFTEGFGFSRNPSLGLSAPDYEDVVVDVPEGVTDLAIELKYMFGSDDKQKETRRRMKRR